MITGRVRQKKRVWPAAGVGVMVLMIAVLLVGPATALADDGGVAAIDSGDTAWMIVSTALVMLMTPGLAFFYGGLVRRKNVLSVMMQCFMLLGVLSMQWVLFG